MKKIKYDLLQGFTKESKPITIPVYIAYSESNVLLAEQEAYNGKYEIVDCEQPDTEPKPSASLEERVTSIESDVASLTAAIEKGLAL